LSHTLTRPPPESLLRIEVARTGTTADVRLIGEMDLSTRGELVDALSRGLDDTTVVQLDLAGLDFCDAAGITELLATRDALALAQRSCAGVRPRPNLLRLFTLAGLSDLLVPEPQVA